ncbi:MAG: beta-lactamase family protein [Phycisphaerae bacterium]|nr:beta-lactamase family protein [Phycisphaerae bacterium]
MDVLHSMTIRVICLVTVFAAASARCTETHRQGDTQVTDRLELVRSACHVPAVAGALVTSEGLTVVGVVGVRKQGTSMTCTLQDRWHLGSETKAMTAMLAARLVEQGCLTWETTVADVFPDLSDTLNEAFRIVTVRQLLSHHAGLPVNLDLNAYAGKPAPLKRRLAVQQELAKDPLSKPGSTYLYSNLGYIIVGAIIEQVTGQSWEEAVRKQIFDPLGMTTVGFGGLGTPGQVDQPWGHDDKGDPVRRSGPTVDNPPVMGPAGRVHCTIQDWGLFVADMLKGLRGEAALLTPDSYQTLAMPQFGSTYALGWVVAQRDWAGGKVLTHAGSNTMNYATVWIAPQRNFAILVCVNQGGDAAAKACDSATEALIELQNELASQRVGP